MPRVTPNLHFSGRCGQALALYERALGAKRTVLLHYRDADPADFDEPLTEAQKDYVYHAEMELYGQRVLLNDALAGEETRRIPVSLAVIFEEAAQVRDAFERMREGAIILSPLAETTYSSAFVSFQDRYGVRWELMTET